MRAIAAHPHHRSRNIKPEANLIEVAYLLRGLPRAGRTSTLAAVDKAVADERVLLVQTSSPEMEAAVRGLIEALPQFIEARRGAAVDSRIRALLDAYLPDDVAGPALGAIANDNARAQASFLEVHPTLTSREVAALAGHGARNAAATAARWKAAGRIFSVPVRAQERFPAFQFDVDRPRPAVARALAALPDAMSAWQTALWFASGNSWLDGAAPLDRLDDPDAVATTAGREGDLAAG